jgi:hypothetical protein
MCWQCAYLAKAIRLQPVEKVFRLYFPAAEALLVVDDDDMLGFL